MTDLGLDISQAFVQQSNDFQQSFPMNQGPQPVSSYDVPPMPAPFGGYGTQPMNGHQQAEGLSVPRYPSPPVQRNHFTPGMPCQDSPVPGYNPERYGDARDFLPPGSPMLGRYGTSQNLYPNGLWAGHFPARGNTPMPDQFSHHSNGPGSSYPYPPVDSSMQPPSSTNHLNRSGYAPKTPVGCRKRRSTIHSRSPSVRNMNLLGNHHLVPTPPFDRSRREHRSVNWATPSSSGTPFTPGPTFSPDFMDLDGSTPRASRLNLKSSSQLDYLATPKPPQTRSHVRFGIRDCSPETPMRPRSKSVLTSKKDGNAESFRDPFVAARKATPGRFSCMDEPGDPMDTSDDEEMCPAPDIPRRPFNAIIKRDGFDVLNPQILERILKACKETPYINTPQAIFTYHQLELADQIFYRGMWRQLFMVNDAQIFEYHQPELFSQATKDATRQDRRLIYVWVNNSSGGPTWCRVFKGNKIFPVPTMMPPPAKFDNVLNLKGYLLERLPDIGLMDYARGIAPEQVDFSPEGDDINAALLGMHQHADRAAAALVPATREEAATRAACYLNKPILLRTRKDKSAKSAVTSAAASLVPGTAATTSNIVASMNVPVDPHLTAISMGPITENQWLNGTPELPQMSGPDESNDPVYDNVLKLLEFNQSSDLTSIDDSLASTPNEKSQATFAETLDRQQNPFASPENHVIGQNRPTSKPEDQSAEAGNFFEDALTGLENPFASREDVFIKTQSSICLADVPSEPEDPFASPEGALAKQAGPAVKVEPPATPKKTRKNKVTSFKGA
ncbi:hypothetical protein GGS21DRAFT_449411 [Xylaria nigripes]|nr:hypothetical protein GGS21DRAFT_449411 [Xylaria nigripes]